MLHMQHAHVVALIVRQHEAALLKEQRDAARREAAAVTAGKRPIAARRAPKSPLPRTA